MRTDLPEFLGLSDISEGQTVSLAHPDLEFVRTLQFFHPEGGVFWVLQKKNELLVNPGLDL